MFDIIKLVLELGIDVSSRAGLKTALNMLGINEQVADDVYIALKNYLNHDGFAKVPYSQRILFLPQCLRSSKKCKAEMSDVGYICKGCGACVIDAVKTAAEKLGYRVYIMPGGSMTMRVIQEQRPRAILGVACKFELCEAIEKLGTRIWVQTVPLSKAGCRDTVVDVDAVLKAVRLKA